MAELPRWSLCIATLNRRDALMRTLIFAAHQTCPPSQIVIVDVSDDWEESRAQAQRLLAPFPDIALEYVTSEVRSSATQRNEGIALCRHEIVFLLDDDSFLYPTAAEEVLRVYAADTAEEVAGIALSMKPGPPPEPDAHAPTVSLQRKASGKRHTAGLRAYVIRSALGRWVVSKILLQDMNELFLRYDGSRRRPVPESLEGLDVSPVNFMGGFATTARLSIAQAEPFDTALRYYAAFEDLDVSYRYARHGALLRADRAHVHHFEAAGGRLKRKKVIIFQLLNMAVFIKRHAADPDAHRGAYRWLMVRRLIGEALKDALSGRFGFPQLRGVLTAMRLSGEIWRRDAAEFDAWYPGFQKRILDRL